MPCLLSSQTVSSRTSTKWSTDKNKECSFGPSSLELKPNKTFIWTWDLKPVDTAKYTFPVIDYGKYTVSKDTLVLSQTHIRDYYGFYMYGEDSSKHPHRSIWCFIVKGDTMTPFFFGVARESRLDTMIAEIEPSCSLILDTRWGAK